MPHDLPFRDIGELLDDPARNAALFNAFPSLVWCADAQGLCSFVNQAWEDYTGRDVAAERGLRWLDAVHADDRAGLERAWNEALGLRRSFEREYRLLRADGSHGWVHHAAVPVNGGDGRLVGYLGSVNDITEQRAAELNARDKEREIRTLADNVPILISYFAAKDLTCIFANKAYAQMWGWNEKSILGRTVPEVIGAEGYKVIGPYIDRVMQGEPVTYERTVKMPEGAERILEVNLLPQFDEGGATVAAFVLISDITRHRHAEQVIRESEDRLRKFADATHEGIVFHEEGRITDCNQAILRLTGYTYEELIGTEVMQYVAPDCRDTVLSHVETEYERPYESVILHKDGRRLPVEFEGRTMPFKDKIYRLAVVKDIRRRKESQARIDYLAHHDMLTGLPNRALLLDRLEFILASAKRRGTQVGVLFIDLDNFKTVNDSLGHLAGDELLKAVAKRILATLRIVDVVSRHGGDEFLVVLPDLEDSESAVPVAEKLIAAISEPVDLEGQSLVVSPSIGISIYPKDGLTTDKLIRSADAAMYLAKESGRSNYQFFNKGLSDQAFRVLTLETRLREAIRQEAFQLHYQPQVRVADGAITGVEALIRWPQKDGTWIEPAEFIPVAEQRGLIRTIGAWVLHEACRQNRLWQDAGLAPMPIAINLSTIQFRQKNFLAEVADALSAAHLDPRFLAFELTEGMLQQETLELSRTLAGLRELGVKIAIDDFGTGSSSLMNLKRYPIDKLKIDRTFVKDIPGDPDDVAIVCAIIDLARNMGITSIAEGVDDLNQLQFLSRRGCDEAQGYLFCKALPADKLAAWLAKPHTGTITSALTA